MYAIGLLASFCINIGCLLIYRYFRGTKDIRDYYTSRTGTLLLEFILVACFIYLALHKPYGTGLWARGRRRHPRSPASRSRAATGPR